MAPPPTALKNRVASSSRLLREASNLGLCSATWAETSTLGATYTADVLR